MILFLHGDEHAAAAFAHSPFTWASEDHWNQTRGERAHPENIPYGFGYRLALLLHIGFHSAVTRTSTVDSIISDYLRFRTANTRHTVVVSWSAEHCKDIAKISDFSKLLQSEGVEHIFINSSSRLEADSKFWVWNPNSNDLVSWAAAQNLIQDGHLTAQAHVRLANLLMFRLTEQMDDLILRT